MTRPGVLGAVLAGGRSSRFGSDKAGAMLAGRTLLAHAAALLRPHAAAVVVVGGAPRAGLEAAPDRPAPGLGPLGGVAGALAHAAAHGYGSVLTVACDTPRVPDGLLDALLRRAPSYCEDSPTIGHWSATLSPTLLAHLEGNGDRSVRRWARSVGAIPVPACGNIANINTPADLAALEERATSPA